MRTSAREASPPERLLHYSPHNTTASLPPKTALLDKNKEKPKNKYQGNFSGAPTTFLEAASALLGNAYIHLSFTIACFICYMSGYMSRPCKNIQNTENKNKRG